MVACIINLFNLSLFAFCLVAKLPCQDKYIPKDYSDRVTCFTIDNATGQPEIRVDFAKVG